MDPLLPRLFVRDHGSKPVPEWVGSSFETPTDSAKVAEPPAFYGVDHARYVHGDTEFTETDRLPNTSSQMGNKLP
ncbi:hypothetical protein FOPE_04891 [Fonsecaea pedrosoi]|nr:hypothetical protein FOPE_04891 [Fonsecaea pedrosoi]